MSSVTSQNPQNFANLKCSPTTLICKEKTVVLGDVTIGSECVVHPTATIIAKNGPIKIGSNNLIEERVSIINNRSEPMIIEDNNLFEVDSYCEARKVGNKNILEPKSRVEDNIEISDNCIIGAGCVLNKPDYETNEEVHILPEGTVISGASLDRRTVKMLPANSRHSSQLDFLRKILPNYQKLWRPANTPATPLSK